MSDEKRKPVIFGPTGVTGWSRSDMMGFRSYERWEYAEHGRVIASIYRDDNGTFKLTLCRVEGSADRDTAMLEVEDLIEYGRSKGLILKTIEGKTPTENEDGVAG